MGAVARTDGDGDRVVVVAHGWALDSGVWDAARAHTDLAAFTYVFVDFPGYGTAIDEPPAESMEDMAGALLDVVDGLGRGRCSLLGHGMGAAAVLQAACLEPDRIDRLALLAPVTGDPPEIDDDLHARLADAFADPGWFLRLVGPDLTDEQVAWLAERARQGVSEAAWRQYLANWADPGFADDLEGLGLPTRLVLGANDPVITVDYATAAANALDNANIVTLEDAGHYPMIERPAAAVQAWEPWLRLGR